MTNIDKAAKEFREALMLEGTVGVFGIPSDDFFEIAEHAFRRGWAAAAQVEQTGDPEFLIAFELNEDYESELEAYLEDPSAWGDKPFDWLDYAEWHLVCPHCGAEDEIVEVDDAQRWNELLTEDVDFSGGKMYVKADQGEHGDYEFLKFMCSATGCLKTVDAPEVFEIEGYVF